MCSSLHTLRDTASSTERLSTQAMEACGCAGRHLTPGPKQMPGQPDRVDQSKTCLPHLEQWPSVPPGVAAWGAKLGH